MSSMTLANGITNLVHEIFIDLLEREKKISINNSHPLPTANLFTVCVVSILRIGSNKKPYFFTNHETQPRCSQSFVQIIYEQFHSLFNVFYLLHFQQDSYAI